MATDSPGAPRPPVAAVFDLDGVVTFTARLHASSWTELFDGFLRAWHRRHGGEFRPFTPSDYRSFVDGRPRLDGVRTFLGSRGIELPEGTADDAPGAPTVHGLGNRKNQVFLARLEAGDVPVDEDAVRLVRALRRAGVRVGVATSSKNGERVLARAGLDDLFEARVDGLVSQRLGLPGKPAPDIFLECLKRLGGGDPARCLLVEDAVAGVQAGRAGGFGVVLGVDRHDQWLALREHGATWIVRGFESLTPERIAAYFAGLPHARPNAIARWGDLAAELPPGPVEVCLAAGVVRDPGRLAPRSARVVDSAAAAVEAMERASGGAGAGFVFLGHGPSDEAAFRALGERGIGILVAEVPRPTAARFSLQDEPEVLEVVNRLTREER